MKSVFLLLNCRHFLHIFMTYDMMPKLIQSVNQSFSTAVCYPQQDFPRVLYIAETLIGLRSHTRERETHFSSVDELLALKSILKN